MNIIDLQTKRQERARDTARMIRAIAHVGELPSIAYMKALEAELLAERALGTVSAELLTEVNRVISICSGGHIK